MLKRKIMIVAILTTVPALASAEYKAPWETDTWTYGAPNRVADPAPTPADFKHAQFPVDPWVFYPANRVIERVGVAPRTAQASSDSGRSVFCTNNPDDAGYFGPVDCAAVRAAAASPTDRSRPVSLGLLGTLVQSRPDSTLKVSSTTGSIYVEHLKTARIENDKGQSFTWQFDSPMSISNFPLNSIAPSGFDAGKTMVVILHPALHTAP